MKCSADGYHHVDCTDDQLSLWRVLDGARHCAQVLTDLVHHPHTHEVAVKPRRRGKEGKKGRTKTKGDKQKFSVA